MRHNFLVSKINLLTIMCTIMRTYWCVRKWHITYSFQILFNFGNANKIADNNLKQTKATEAKVYSICSYIKELCHHFISNYTSYNKHTRFTQKSSSPFGTTLALLLLFAVSNMSQHFQFLDYGIYIMWTTHTPKCSISPKAKKLASFAFC